jgi:hypothetical protein
MTLFRGMLGGPEGKPTALACQLTKKVNKVEELIYLSTNIATDSVSICLKNHHILISNLKVYMFTTYSQVCQQPKTTTKSLF